MARAPTGMLVPARSGFDATLAGVIVAWKSGPGSGGTPGLVRSGQALCRASSTRATILPGDRLGVGTVAGHVEKISPSTPIVAIALGTLREGLGLVPVELQIDLGEDVSAAE